jgi:hypothetical protein
MMQANTLTVLEAGRLAGRSKSHIFRAIKSGTLSAERDESGNYRIDPAELARVFPLARPSAPDDLTRNGHDTGLAQLEARLADAQDQIGDLRRRLDNSEEERRALNARLLTDQRPVRQWWRWRS